MSEKVWWANLDKQEIAKHAEVNASVVESLKCKNKQQRAVIDELVVSLEDICAYEWIHESIPDYLFKAGNAAIKKAKGE